MHKSLIIKALLVCTLFFVTKGAVGQEPESLHISGNIKDTKGYAIPDALISITDLGLYIAANDAGFFKMTCPAGQYQIVVSAIGYIPHASQYTISKGNRTLDFTLTEDPNMMLEEVDILGKSLLQEVEETGFNVVAVDVKPLRNTTIDMTQVLDRISGVKIRQEGGTGSATNVTINGLSGRHVRFFIDGMPMDAMGSAFQLNNLPTNLVEHVEVYKGVVPVNFGSDALGGAVNIVTRKSAGTYLDASYSYGSFNTHKTFVNAGHTTSSGLMAQVSAYQNYADNDYYIYADVLDFETNLYSQEPVRVKRFHDQYHNEAVIAKLGIVNKPFADQLLVGFTYSQAYKEIQHPAYTNIAFGEKYTNTMLIMPSFLYQKENLMIKGLSVSVAGNYNFGGGENYDLSDQQYNWLGEHEADNSQGEIAYSEYIYDDRNGTFNSNVNYKFLEKHTLTLNNVTTLFSRDGDEKVVEDDFTNERPRSNNRNILGASYKIDFNDKLSASAFGKRYDYKAKAYIDLTGDEIYHTERSGDTKYGYGLTGAYFLTEKLQIKGNYELTCRLPTDSELFGEVFGFYQMNFTLRPETSRNYNIGANFNHTFSGGHLITTDVNLFYRNTQDYIRRNINYSQGEATFENMDLVKISGFDVSVRYSRNKTYTLGLSFSNANARDYTEGSTLYKGRLPNSPYAYGNLDASYFFNNLFGKSNKMGITYNLLYLHSFPYDNSNYQASNGREIPEQWGQDIYITYTLQNGKYNLSLDCKNIFDAKLYDNFSLQKPGRSFSVKVRYFIHKN